MEQYDMPALVEADPDANATDLLIDRVAETPDLALFAVPTADGGWSDVTAAEFLRQVRALAKGFIAAGIEPGDKVGLMCKTRYEWTLVDFAMWFAGAVLVPIYETSSPAQVLWKSLVPTRALSGDEVDGSNEEQGQLGLVQGAAPWRRGPSSEIAVGSPSSTFAVGITTTLAWALFFCCFDFVCGSCEVRLERPFDGRAIPLLC